MSATVWSLFNGQVLHEWGEIAVIIVAVEEVFKVAPVFRDGNSFGESDWDVGADTGECGCVGKADKESG